MYSWEADAKSRFWRWIWSRFVFELVIWPQEVTLIRWTQPSGPLCLWQCFYFSGRGQNMVRIKRACPLARGLDDSHENWQKYKKVKVFMKLWVGLPNRNVHPVPVSWIWKKKRTITITIFYFDLNNISKCQVCESLCHCVSVCLVVIQILLACQVLPLPTLR